jgi:hypothetical protein
MKKSEILTAVVSVATAVVLPLASPKENQSIVFQGTLLNIAGHQENTIQVQNFYMSTMSQDAAAFASATSGTIAVIR